MQSNFIEPATEFQVETIPLKQLYEMYKTNRIQPYAAWLQRLKQESKWSAKDWLKARSYLYRLFSSGQTSKSMYTVVRIDTLLNRLNELNQNLHNMNIKKCINTYYRIH